MIGVLVMRKLEEESSSGLHGLDGNQLWNIEHAFWFRFLVAAVTTTVWVVMGIRMGMYGITIGELWEAGLFLGISIVAWIGFGRQGYLIMTFSEVLNSLSEDVLSGEYKPW
jgi:hypothetical protein